MDNDFNPFEFAGEEVPLAPVLDMSLSDYIEHPAPSRSLLWDFESAESPYHFHYEQEEKPPADAGSDAMVLGSAIHLAVLEPDAYASRVAVWTKELAVKLAKLWDLPPPTGSTVTRRGQIWTRLRDEQNAKRHLALTPGQDATARRIAEWVRGRKGIRRLFANGLAERTIIARNREVGHDYKVRIDFLDPDQRWIVEIKSAHDLNPWALYRSSRSHGYHMQAAMQLDAARAAGFDVREHYTFWVASAGAPWARLTQTPTEALAEGSDAFERALRGWKECRRTGEWPAPKFEKETLIWEETL